MNLRALAMVAWVSCARSASTSVETPWHQFGQLGAHADGETVGDFVDGGRAIFAAVFAAPGQFLLDQLRIDRQVQRFLDQRGIGGAVDRLQALDGVVVAGIGNDDRQLTQLSKLGGDAVMRVLSNRGRVVDRTQRVTLARSAL